MPKAGTAWVRGIIGMIPVVASQPSLGASFAFSLLETKASREEKPQWIDFIKRDRRFVLVFSYLIGAITGPGIWYAITVLSPRGVDGLISAIAHRKRIFRKIQ